MKILLNGESHETSARTIGELVDSLELERNWVVVEQNLEVPDRAKWNETPLSEKDRIEIVRFLGGG